MAADAVACMKAGAAELHVHPRGADLRESLAAVDADCRGRAQRLPGNADRRVDRRLDRVRCPEKPAICIAAWSVLPDYASVNLSEPDAPHVMALLQSIGVGIEAGLATVADAERFVALADHQKAFRILIEIEEQERTAAFAITEAIATVLESAGAMRSILLHGFDATAWDFVKLARQRTWSTRIGLEDCRHLPDGCLAAGNAALVAEAAEIYRRD